MKKWVKLSPTAPASHMGYKSSLELELVPRWDAKLTVPQCWPLSNFLIHQIFIECLVTWEALGEQIPVFMEVTLCCWEINSKSKV